MSLPFTLDALNTSIADGRVTERAHPTLPLYIYNYSPEVQYDNRWDEVTLNCRGLILDEAGNIVARPWRKFFNLGQVDLPIQFDDPVEVMDKADGSLGILYPNGDGTYAIATRGSFTSEQAYFATFKIWNEKYSHLIPTEGYTLLFEIVYPSNRIVLDYGDTEDLVLLGAVGTETGYYYGPNHARYFFHNREPYREANWPGPVVEVMPYKSISEALGHLDRKNAEGYVIRSHNFMVKAKQPDYIDLHRLVTNASPKTVWEQLRAGKSKSEIVSAFPDEFHDYIGSMIDPLLERYAERTDEILDGYCKALARAEDLWGLDTPPDRKTYAKAFKASQDARYYFLLLDSRSIREVLWTELKPKEPVSALSR